MALNLIKGNDLLAAGGEKSWLGGAQAVRFRTLRGDRRNDILGFVRVKSRGLKSRGHGKGVRAGIALRGGDHNSGETPPTAKTPVVVFTICETTMFAVHLFTFVNPFNAFWLPRYLCRATVAN